MKLRDSRFQQKVASRPTRQAMSIDDKAKLRAAVNEAKAFEYVYDSIEKLAQENKYKMSPSEKKEHDRKTEEHNKQNWPNSVSKPKTPKTSIPLPSELNPGDSVVYVKSTGGLRSEDPNVDDEKDTKRLFVRYRMGQDGKLFAVTSMSGNFRPEKESEVSPSSADKMVEVNKMKGTGYKPFKEDVPKAPPMVDPKDRGSGKSPSQLRANESQIYFDPDRGIYYKFYRDYSGMTEEEAKKATAPLKLAVGAHPQTLSKHQEILEEEADAKAKTMEFVEAKGTYGNLIEDQFRGKTKEVQEKNFTAFLDKLKALRTRYDAAQQNLSESVAGGADKSDYSTFDREKGKMVKVPIRHTKSDTRDRQRKLDDEASRIERFSNNYAKIVNTTGMSIDDNEDIIWMEDEANKLRAKGPNISDDEKDTLKRLEKNVGPSKTYGDGSEKERRNIERGDEDLRFNEEEDAHGAFSTRIPRGTEKIEDRSTSGMTPSEKAQHSRRDQPAGVPPDEAAKQKAIDDAFEARKRELSMKVKKRVNNTRLLKERNKIMENGGPTSPTEEQKVVQGKNITPASLEQDCTQAELAEFKEMADAEAQGKPSKRTTPSIVEKGRHVTVPGLKPARPSGESAKEWLKGPKAPAYTKTDGSDAPFKEIEYEKPLTEEEANAIREFGRGTMHKKESSFGSGTTNHFMVKVQHESGSAASANELSSMLKSLGTSGIVEVQEGAEGLFKIDLPEELEHKLITDGHFKVQIDQFILESTGGEGTPEGIPSQDIDADAPEAPGEQEASLVGDNLSTEEPEGTGKIGQAMPPAGPPAAGGPPGIEDAPEGGPEGAPEEMPEAPEDERSMIEIVDTVKSDVEALSQKINNGDLMDGGRELEPATSDSGSMPAPPGKIAVDQPAKDYWEDLLQDYGKRLTKDYVASIDATIDASSKAHNRELTAADKKAIKVWLREDPRNQHTAGRSLYIEAASAAGTSPAMANVVHKLLINQLMESCGDFGLLTAEVKPHVFAMAVARAKVGNKMARAIEAARKVGQKMKSPSISKQPDDAVDIAELEDMAEDAERAREAHLDICIDRHWVEGAYTKMDLSWDTEDEGWTGGALKHAIISFVKGLESTKEFEDFGVLGTINFDEFDADAGVATVFFKSSRPGDAPTRVVTDIED